VRHGIIEEPDFTDEDVKLMEQICDELGRAAQARPPSTGTTGPKLENGARRWAANRRRRVGDLNAEILELDTVDRPEPPAIAAIPRRDKTSRKRRSDRCQHPAAHHRGIIRAHRMNDGPDRRRRLRAPGFQASR